MLLFFSKPEIFKTLHKEFEFLAFSCPKLVYFWRFANSFWKMFVWYIPTYICYCKMHSDNMKTQFIISLFFQVWVMHLVLFWEAAKRTSLRLLVLQFPLWSNVAKSISTFFRPLLSWANCKLHSKANGVKSIPCSSAKVRFLHFSLNRVKYYWSILPKH